jgi:uncharacterized protein YndB with AHSA1/START domain
VYREIVPPERFVHTESWEDWNPGESLVTTVLVEQGGKTTLKGTVLYPSQEVATPSSPLAWSTEPPRATINSMRCWRRQDSR